MITVSKNTAVTKLRALQIYFLRVCRALFQMKPSFECLFLVIKFSVRVNNTYKASSRLLSAHTKLQTLSALRGWLLSA